jgi:hypothetical protein
MKLKSFLFLTAALALGLAFASCGDDSSGGGGTERITVSEPSLYTTKAEEITMALHDAPSGYGVTLNEDVDISGDVVIIPTDKTLYVNGRTITVSKDTVIVAAGGLDFGGPASTSIIEGTSAVVIGKDYVEGRYSAGEYAADDNIFGINFGEIGAGKYVGSAGVATGWNIAVNSLDNLGALAAGTKGYVLGGLTAASNLSVAAGTLYVSGNLTIGTDKAINSAAPIYVYGEVKGGTDASQTLITGTVSAVSADITGGQIANDLTIFRDGKFGDDVTFKGALNVRRDATFGKVEFADTATVAKKATFTSSKLVAGSVTVGNLAFTGSSNTLVLKEDGQIIFLNGSIPAFFNTAGTLAALTGSVSFTVDANKLTVDGKGKGTFAVGNNGINLATANSIQVAAETGVYFDGEGSIASANYSIGNAAGTLSADVGFILTATGIQAISGATTTPAITFEVAEDNGISLSLNNGRNAIINGVNIDISSAGSIGVYEGNLIITNGGSVTTAADSIAWSGTIAGSAAGGSLLVGSVGVTGGTTEAGIAAGSVGTSSSEVVGVILKGDGFITTAAAVSDGKTGAGKFNDGGSATAAGSILVFSHN